jgi:signal peptidase I
MPEYAVKTNTSRETSTPRPKSQIREYTEAGLVALIAALLLRTFVVQAFRIPTGSMKDTLLIGDFLLVNKFVYGARTLTVSVY